MTHIEMNPSRLRDAVDWIGRDTIVLGYTVQALVNVSTEVPVNRLPQTVWSELALDDDPQHLSSFAREDLLEFLVARAHLDDQYLSTPRSPHSGTSHTSVEVLNTDVWVQSIGDLVKPEGTELDLQALPDSEMPVPSGDTDTTTDTDTKEH